MLNSRPKLTTPTYQNADKGETLSGASKEQQQQEQNLKKLEQMYKHKFSWMDDNVDIRDECPMCMIYINSPCYDSFMEYNKADDDKTEFKTSLRELSEVSKDKEMEYKLYVKKADLAWDRLMKCVTPIQSTFLQRQDELQTYMKSVKNFEKQVFQDN
ncbi:hypothetical protein FDP41_008659 [Naegleria fowleri]|uniref:Uncharacterized protein n=1 Tax=Naegleria fowleri TaxID=5763 RepID=A0A6A5BG67_NAEFO|nr:uncharacterized protein FDP41_008659 [Naegleria fowleri]KAF0972995.1 hypothetical protein FDP41_008659 [Naegleria fowleri]CAG4719273.1 unnamed protein product [Naegleria fowleri]